MDANVVFGAPFDVGRSVYDSWHQVSEIFLCSQRRNTCIQGIRIRGVNISLSELLLTNSCSICVSVGFVASLLSYTSLSLFPTLFFSLSLSLSFQPFFVSLYLWLLSLQHSCISLFPSLTLSLVFSILLVLRRVSRRFASAENRVRLPNVQLDLHHVGVRERRVADDHVVGEECAATQATRSEVADAYVLHASVRMR